MLDLIFFSSICRCTHEYSANVSKLDWNLTGSSLLSAKLLFLVYHHLLEIRFLPYLFCIITPVLCWNHQQHHHHHLKGLGFLASSFLSEIISSRLWSSYIFFSLQVCNVKFCWVICCHPFCVYVSSNLFYIALICH